MRAPNLVLLAATSIAVAVVLLLVLIENPAIDPVGQPAAAPEPEADEVPGHGAVSEGDQSEGRELSANFVKADTAHDGDAALG